MPRPRLATDDAILTASARVLLRDGPDRFTLAEVARQVGLSRAALIARFDNRDGLRARLSDRTRQELMQLEGSVPVTNKGPRQVLNFVEALGRTMELPLVLVDSEACRQLRDALVARLDEPSRRRAGEVADLLMAVLRGASAECKKGDAAMHLRGRLQLCLRLVYAGCPGREEDGLSVVPAARAG